MTVALRGMKANETEPVVRVGELACTICMLTVTLGPGPLPEEDSVIVPCQMPFSGANGVAWNVPLGSI